MTPTDMLAKALPFLESHWDCGPDGEGWQSDELRALIRDIKQELAFHKE